jgi:hypothetical protein
VNTSKRRHDSQQNVTQDNDTTEQKSDVLLRVDIEPIMLSVIVMSVVLRSIEATTFFIWGRGQRPTSRLHHSLDYNIVP